MVKISEILQVPRRTRRIANISSVLVSEGFGYVVNRLRLGRFLPARLRITGRSRFVEPTDLPERLANVLEKLGPTAVKFGQMLSTRPDLLPPEYARELQRICHHVAPFPAQEARSILERELGSEVGEIFDDFDDEPVASGSIAQVHKARLKSGKVVVVKVRRPRIKRTVEDDIAIMHYLATQADRLEEFKPLRVPLLVEEFSEGIRREMNLLSEAADTHKFHAAFLDDKSLVVPKVYWDFCSPAILTMEMVDGVFLSDFSQSTGPERSPGLDRRVSMVILDRFLRQYFELGYFHADPHTGNILLTDDNRVALIDFGLTGRLGDELRSRLGAFIIALGKKQFELAAHVLAETGAFPPDVDEEAFEAETAALLERYYHIPFEKIDMQQAFQDVMHIVRKHNGMMPRNFVLLGKSLVTVGGMINQLSAGINAAELVAPYAQNLVIEKFKPETVSKRLTEHAYEFSTLLRTMPRDLRQLIGRLKSGAIEFAIDHRGLERYLLDLDRTGNRLALSIILAAILISSTTILTAELGPSVVIFGWEASALGLMGYLFGFILGIWLVLGIFRSGTI